MQAHGGLLTFDDLSASRFGSRAAQGFVSRPDDRHAAAAGGGIVVAEMLRILERFDLTALGHNAPDYIRVIAEAMKIAGGDDGIAISAIRISWAAAGAAAVGCLRG